MSQNIKQNKTKQNKTKQNKTKQNKTKQNKTQLSSEPDPTHYLEVFCQYLTLIRADGDPPKNAVYFLKNMLPKFVLILLRKDNVAGQDDPSKIALYHNVTEAINTTFQV